MPVIHPDRLEEAPAACNITGFGVTRFRKGEKPNLELHFHDGDEVWYVIEGKIRSLSEDKEYIVGEGEALFTEAGRDHNLLEILEDSVVLWVEQDLRGRKRPGHLHRPQDPWP